MKKYFLLLLFCVSVSPDIFGISSQDDFYSVGSDFLAVQNPENADTDYPQIYTLYPNTLVSLDINNDGAYDYSFLFDTPGLHILSTNWQIVDGTRIHSNKPIQYVQQVYLSTKSTKYPSTTFKEDKFLTILPIQNFRNEYLLPKGVWYFLSDEITNISVDNYIDGTVDLVIPLNKTTKSINATSATKVFSGKNFIAYSSNGLGGLISNDFITNEEKVYIIVPQDNTHISFDYNIDGTTDYDTTYSKGEYNFTLPKPSRIISDNGISAFGYVDGLTGYTIHLKSYFSLPMTSSISNEFSIGVNNDFGFAQDKGHSLIGVFNNDSARGASFVFETYDATLEKIKEYSNFTTAKTQTLGQANGVFTVNSSLPLIDSAYYYYNSASYIRYYVGHTIAYKKVYMTTFGKEKSVSKDSQAVFGIRIFNPFKESEVNGITVKFPINNAFSMPMASVNGRIASLIYDGSAGTFSKAVTISNDGKEDYFIFTYDGSLSPESYMDLDFTLVAPSSEGLNTFSPATMTYTSPTWII